MPCARASSLARATSASVGEGFTAAARLASFIRGGLYRERSPNRISP